MDNWLDGLRPLPRPSGAPAAHVAHAHLRALVLDGAIPPGAVMNQVDIADRLGMSRTPVREAIRMLQEEGLVEAEPFKRARVVGFDAAQLEAVYVQRIMLEGLGTAMTVPRMTGAQCDDLSRMAQELNRTSPGADRTDEWNSTHNRFHMALVSGVSEHLRRTIETNMQRAEQFRAMYHYRGPLPSFQHAGGHERIAALCVEGDAAGAASELVVHLARSALSMIGQLAPRYDPVAVRLSLDRVLDHGR
ncbi:transcriptional regulator [Lentzea pudingi]|uniref:Transcriptional regulator n=1 Tax=Lentzea pudingi TaxID=1789439 RepID=A0ABQ2IS01_9PSEU|nr:GntR family transcriptional regulator [Lentzea pudingi]GGN28703.1 transcriptional regulator [Lentzea pudingi]